MYVMLSMCLLSLILLVSPARAEERMLVYVATVPEKSNSQQGIYKTTLNMKTGLLAPPELVIKTNRSSFITIHPNGRFLYACNEIGEFQGKKTGAASAFAIDPTTGKLTALNDQPSGGQGPCYVRVDGSGKNLLVANYGGGSVAVLPIDETTGTLAAPSATVQHEGKSVDPNRQQGPHAHSFNPSPDNRFALACDLGLDKVMVYQLESAEGELTANDPPSASVAPGAGPRHLAFSNDGKFVYVGNEMGNTVTAFAYDAQQGALKEIQSLSTLPEAFAENSFVAEVAMHPTGRFLYISNRGHNSIAVFSVDPASGRLTAVNHPSTGGDWPRHFKIDPSGKWMIVANQNSGDLVSFAIDQEKGTLAQAGSKVELAQPMCVQFYAPMK